jgi:hypothetical protein
VSVSVAIVRVCYCQGCCVLSLGRCRCDGKKVVDECKLLGVVVDEGGRGARS